MCIACIDCPIYCIWLGCGVYPDYFLYNYRKISGSKNPDSTKFKNNEHIILYFFNSGYSNDTDAVVYSSKKFCNSILIGIYLIPFFNL